MAVATLSYFIVLFSSFNQFIHLPIVDKVAVR